MKKAKKKKVKKLNLNKVVSTIVTRDKSQLKSKSSKHVASIFAHTTKEEEKEEQKISENSKVASTNDIDSIFALLKKDKEKTNKKQRQKVSSSSTQSMIKERHRSTSRQTSHQPRKFCDGVPIYTCDELSINLDSGGTELCPFDCECCF